MQHKNIKMLHPLFQGCDWPNIDQLTNIQEKYFLLVILPALDPLNFGSLNISVTPQIM